LVLGEFHVAKVGILSDSATLVSANFL